MEGRDSSAWKVFRTACFDPDSWLFDWLNSPEPVGTSIPALDSALIGGLRPGIHTIMAAPGAGKSALALHIALMAAWQGKRVFYVSLEMGAEDCWARWCSEVSALAPEDAPRVTPFMWSSVQRMGYEAGKAIQDGRTTAMELMGSHAFMVTSRWLSDNVPELTVTDKATSIDQIKVMLAQAAGAGAGLVVIDYLQLIDVPGTNGDYERITVATNALKDMARDLGIPMLVVSSRNRAGNKGDASLFAGAGSSAIEYASTSVWVLECTDEEPLPDVRHIELSIKKNRAGRWGTKPIEFAFDAPHNLIMAKSGD